LLEAKLPQLLAPGTPAPAFTLHATPDQTLSFSELRGKPVILAFYPADWSPVCGDEMALLNQVRPAFQKFGKAPRWMCRLATGGVSRCEHLVVVGRAQLVAHPHGRAAPRERGLRDLHGGGGNRCDLGKT